MPKFSTVKEVADYLRREYDLEGDTRSDEELASAYFKRHPEKIDEFQFPRTQQAPVTGSAIGRFAKGTVANLEEATRPRPEDYQRHGFKGGLQDIGDIFKNLTRKVDPIDQMTDLPNIQKDMERGDVAHGVGRATTAAAQIVSLATPFLPKGASVGSKASALSEMSEIGEGAVVDKAAMDVARVITKPVSKALDSQIADIDSAMANQHINAQRLTAGIAYAKKVIAKMKNVPDVKTGDMTAIREAVDTLDESITGKKTMPWTDARQALQRINAAVKNLKGSTGRAIAGEVQTALKDELKSTAKPVIGDVYDSWVADERELHNVQRAHAKAIKGTTPKQMQQTPTESILKRYSKLGRSVEDQKALLKREMINKSQQAIDQLGRKVRGRPKPPIPNKQGPPPPPQGPQGGPPQPPPAPPQGGPQGGGGGPMPPVSGGSGGPMSSLVDKVLGSQKPKSPLQQAIDNLLRPGKNVTNIADWGGPSPASPQSSGSGPASILQMPPRKPIE